MYMNQPMCNRCIHAFYAKDRLRAGASLTFRGCQEDSRIQTWDEAITLCPLQETQQPTVQEDIWSRETRKFPHEWCTLFGVEVVDPDGWRGRYAIPWDVAITLDMFVSRYRVSTCRIVNRERYAKYAHFLS